MLYDFILGSLLDDRSSSLWAVPTVAMSSSEKVTLSFGGSSGFFVTDELRIGIDTMAVRGRTLNTKVEIIITNKEKSLLMCLQYISPVRISISSAVNRTALNCEIFSHAWEF